MKIIEIQQGSPEWLALRARHRCASDAPVMMGASPHLQRTELVRMKASGDAREFSDWVQKNILDKGHAIEAQARVLLEEDLGQELYPVTATDDAGLHLASFDGLTMDEEEAFEHKQWNAELAAAVKAGDPPPLLYWQLEHQLLVGAGHVKRVHVVVSDGTRDKRVSMVYEPVPGRAEQLVRGWAQFEEDVANYVHVEVIPKAVSTLHAGLPSVVIDVKGDVDLVSNLDRVASAVRLYVERIPAKPSTDQEFADCELAVKELQTAQDRLQAAEAAALARFTSVEEMRNTVANLIELVRGTRLRTSKLVEARKVEIRDEIRREGAEAFANHILALNDRLGGPYMPTMVARFADVMKGKKTVTSLRDAVATELARVKIEANATADRIQKNLDLVRAHEAHRFLFADLTAICTKECDYFALLVTSRIEAHQAAEAKRLEAERERIRAEETAKAQAVTAAAAPVLGPNDPPTPIRVERTVATVNPDFTISVGPAPRPLPKTRPTDDEIIDALCLHYRIHESIVIGWLCEMDLEAASQRLAAHFANRAHA